MLDRRRYPLRCACKVMYLHHVLSRQLRVIKVCQKIRKIRDILEANRTFANHRPSFSVTWASGRF